MMSLNKKCDYPSSSSSGSFPFSAFASNTWGCVGVLLTGVKAEVSFSFSISGASEEENIFSSGGNLSQLIEGQALSSSFGKSSSGSVGELECANSKSSRDLQKSVVVGDTADNGNNSGGELGGLLLSRKTIFGENSGYSGQWDWVTIKPGLVKSFMDSIVELRFSSPWEEGVKLHYILCTLMRVLR